MAWISLALAMSWVYNAEPFLFLSFDKNPLLPQRTHLLTLSHFKHSREEEEELDESRNLLLVKVGLTSSQYDALVVESVVFFCFFVFLFLCAKMCASTSTSKFSFHVFLSLAHAHPAVSCLLTAVYFCVTVWALLLSRPPMKSKLLGKPHWTEPTGRRGCMHGSNLRTDSLLCPHWCTFPRRIAWGQQRSVKVLHGVLGKRVVHMEMGTGVGFCGACCFSESCSPSLYKGTGWNVTGYTAVSLL